MDISQKDWRKIITLTICFIMGGCFICLFSYSTSFLYPFFWGNDSAHFLTVGKAWGSGMIPYRDLFEHKGPIIYFIDLLGYTIGAGNKAGVSIIQFVFMCFTLSGIYHISQTVKKSNLYGLIAVVITLISMKMNYVEGNSVEEYCLPFLVWSIYGLIAWYKGERKEHDVRWAFFYGITVGVCAMTRVTNLVTICGGIFVICIYLLIKGHYKNFLLNALTCVCGICVVVLPFVVYFAVNDGLSDMFYDVFLFNVDYSKGCPAWLRSAGSEEIRAFLKMYFVYFSIFFVIGLKLLRKDYLGASSWIITCVIETVLFNNGYAFAQYPLVCLPQVVVFLNEIIVLIEDNSSEKRLLSYILTCFLCLFLYTCIFENASGMKDIYGGHHKYHEREWEELVDEIPNEDYSSFVAYGGNEFKELYLLRGIEPYYKYYMIQEWISKFTEHIRSDVLKTFSAGDVKWILTDGSTSVIDDVLLSRYECVDNKGKYKLYKIKS